MKNKKTGILVGLGVITGAALSIGLAVQAQSVPPVVAAAPTVQTSSVTSATDTDNIKDQGGVEVDDKTGAVDTDNETNDDGNKSSQQDQAGTDTETNDDAGITQ
ncbi:MAG: hypothetical protein JWN37_74 [Candidatus Nomurabacteria bacterium]|nr:hypothetical protein [Candidatus Nomurabacteria bacterium]